MTKSPILWGAGLACALGGAVAGNALGSTPVLDRPTVGAFYQQHDLDYNEATQEPLPQHYPLVTREGTVPVAALSDRGLYSQRRYRAVAVAAEYTPAEAEALSSYEPTPVSYSSGDESLAVGDPGPGRAITGDMQPVAASPLQLEAPATVRASGNAKTVSVTLALADS